MGRWRPIFQLILVCLCFISGSAQFYDIFGSGRKEWRLAFRANAGVQSSVLEAYRHKTRNLVPDDCKTANWSKVCNSHYRNDVALDNWSRVEQVLLGIVQGGVMVKTLTFDGTNSTAMSWMDKDRLLDSCWADLNKDATNFFSLQGGEYHKRRFFINAKYGACDMYKGWLVVVDGPSPNCAWERLSSPGRPFKYPNFLYSPGPTKTPWLGGSAKVADTLAVFLKYAPDGPPDEYFDIQGSGKQEWRLAFRGTPHIQKSVYAAYKDGQDVPDTVEEGCKTDKWTQPCSTHYRNTDALQNWARVQQVLVGLVDGGVLAKTVTFNAKNSTYLSWFSNSRVLKSCWADLKTQHKNHFSIEGDPKPPRRFFISHKYNRCPGDQLWMATVDTHKVACSWERKADWPYFLYAAGPKRENANAPVETRIADALVIFLKYHK